MCRKYAMLCWCYEEVFETVTIGFVFMSIRQSDYQSLQGVCDVLLMVSGGIDRDISDPILRGPDSQSIYLIS